MPYNWMLFDADNTLFDFDAAEENALSSALEQVGIKLEAEHLNIYTKINKECWRAYEDGVLPKKLLRTRRFELFFETVLIKGNPHEFADSYLHYLSQSAMMIDGALELLQELSKGYQLAMITNGLKEVQRSRLAISGISSFFHSIIISDEIGVSKPHSDFFEYTFNQIGHPNKNKVIVIGDNLNSDIRGGQEFGLDTCWYNPQKKEKELDVDPTFEIQDLQEINSFLNS